MSLALDSIRRRFGVGVPIGEEGDWRGWVRDAPLGLLNLAAIGLLRLLPTAAVTAIGRHLGRLLVPRLQQERLARAAGHIAALRPELGTGAEQRLAGSIGALYAEYAILHRLWPQGRVAVEGLEHLRAARDAGRPILLAGLHTANWEVLLPSLTRLGLPCANIYAPPRNRFTCWMVLRVRRVAGARALAPTRLTAREALRVLQAGRETLLIFVDEFAAGRVQAPRFGRPPTVTGNIGLVCRLATATEAAVIPAHVERLPGTRFRVIFSPPVALPQAGSGETALAANVAALEARIAPIVLRQLAEWYFLLVLRRDK